MLFIKMLQMKGNVCLGILNGTEIGLQNLNLIGGTVFFASIGNFLILVSGLDILIPFFFFF